MSDTKRLPALYADSLSLSSSILFILFAGQFLERFDFTMGMLFLLSRLPGAFFPSLLVSHDRYPPLETELYTTYLYCHSSALFIHEIHIESIVLKQLCTR